MAPASSSSSTTSPRPRPRNHGSRTSAIGRYREMVEKVFKEEKVPIDLIWLAQAESVWKPNALSRAAAKGIWQFIPSTGTRYGLAQTAWVDERSQPEKSTRAAARYLRWLHDHFAGDWLLAMAAYNSGENRVDGAIAKCGYADFWELYKRGFAAGNSQLRALHSFDHSRQQESETLRL